MGHRFSPIREFILLLKIGIHGCPIGGKYLLRVGNIIEPFTWGVIMAATLTIRDETATGKNVGETVVEFLTERITVRELIRSRVYQEVQDYNLRQGDTFRGLVQPAGAQQAP